MFRNHPPGWVIVASLIAGVLLTANNLRAQPLQPPAAPGAEGQQPAAPGDEPPKPADAPPGAKPDSDPEDDKGSQSSQSGEITEILGLTMAEWAKKLKDRDPSVRVTALQTVPIFGPKIRPLVAGDLITLTQDKDTSVRTYAIIAIGQLGFETDNTKVIAVRYVAGRLNDQQGVVRLQAAATLAALGSEMPDDARELAIRELTRVTPNQRGIHDLDSWEIRQTSATALGHIAKKDETSPPDQRAVIALSQRLKDPCAQVRRAVIMSLLSLGAPADPADLSKVVEEIRKHALRDPDKSIRVWSRVALMLILSSNNPEYDSLLDQLGDFLEEKDLSIAIEAAQAIGTIGHDAREKIPGLIKLIEHEELSVRISAMWAVGQMKGAGEPAREVLERLVKEHEKEYLGQYAAYILDLIDGKMPMADTGTPSTGETEPPAEGEFGKDR